MKILLALLLLSSTAHAAVTIGAPQGGQGACPFAGCRGAQGIVNVADPPFDVMPGTGDQSGPIQRAIDSLSMTGGIVYFPPGQYSACNLVMRAPYLVFRGAGKEATSIRPTPTCNANLFLQQITSPFTSLAGPLLDVAFEDLTLDANNSTVTNLIQLHGREVARARISRCGFNLANSGTVQGIFVQGPSDVLIEDNEFYSTIPGRGKAVLATNSPRSMIVRNNTCKWVYSCFEWGTGGTDGARFEGNTVNLGWAFQPVKYTNSGGTVTYADGQLTDSAANFQGLCDDTGSAPATCTGNLGNHVRVMTPIVTRASGLANFNAGGSVLTDSGGNFIVAGVKEGDIIRTGKVCRGNGASGTFAKQICSGSAGTSSWGDRCDCTANADCVSGVCEARFTYVVKVNDSTHLQTDEWMSDTDRRPTTAPLQPSYNVYSWVTCSVGSYTSTVINCATTTGVHFKDWGLGTVVTPSNGTLYEVMTRHPNYAFQENAAASESFIAHNVIHWGFSDTIFTQGVNPTVIGNTSSNCWDHCFNLQGTGGRIIGNLARHFGARGVADFSPHSVFSENIGLDGPITATGSSNCPIVVGFTSGLPATAANNKAVNNIALATSTSGHCVQNNTDGVIIQNATCQGTFATACIRNDTANNVNTRIVDYHGETISNVGTFSIEGGRTTQALGTANAAQNGSYFGCSDCTVANPCAGGGTGAVAKRQGGAWVCN